MKKEIKLNPNVDTLEQIINKEAALKEKDMSTMETKSQTVENDYSTYENKTVTSKDITVVKLLKDHEKAWGVTIPIPELGIERKELRDVTLPKSCCKMIETGKKYNAINVPLWLVKRMADDIRNGVL